MKEPYFPALLVLIVLLTGWMGIFGPLPTGVTSWINYWQNLIAAMVALGAAFLAYYSATKQIRQNEKQERNRRFRKHASVRAMLPLALSQITEYARNSAYALNGLIPSCQDRMLPRNSVINGLPQELPHETLKVLAEFIESSDDVDASLVETMVAWMQIHDSRVRTLIRDNQDPNKSVRAFQANIETYIIDAASIYASAAALFDYGRRRDHQLFVDISWDNVRSAFTNMDIWLEQNVHLNDLIKRREQASNGPFDALG